jgi:hypothetical protein
MKPPVLPSSAAASAAIVLAFLAVTAGCTRNEGPEAGNGSRANTATVLLGDPAKESGNGVQYVSANDGQTSPAMLADVPCRQLRLPRGGTGYFYFTLDPAFKKGDLKNVRVEVEYFDDQRGFLSLQFDGSKTWQIPNAAYASADHIVGLTGSQGWKTAVFHIQDATFNNAQNAQADFRLCVNAPELHVRRVAVTRGSEVQPRPQPPVLGTDFSATNTVTIALGEPDREGADGVFHNATERDGRTALTNLDGTPCRYSTMTNKPWAYFYFAIDESFKSGQLKDADIAVEFFAPGRVAINIEFDASKSRTMSAPAFAKAGPDLWLTGSAGWQTNLFQIRNATFENAQNGGADFRLTIRPPHLYVRRVTVTRSPTQTSSVPPAR